MPEVRHPLVDILERNREDGSRGIYSVCSAHPDVLDASLAYAKEKDEPLLVESTSNQVNQYGGYTGMTPGAFAEMMREKAAASGFDPERLWLGGDHLGPFPWRKESAGTAMQKAVDLVRAYVEAGYSKIHLDTSMACADDAHGLVDEETIAERSAVMAAAAEAAYDASGRSGPRPVYVVGTEVPVPGGLQGDGKEGELHVTTSEEVESTVHTIRGAFLKAKLEKAWDRVRALVVQPGVEFGETSVHTYEPGKSEELTKGLRGFPGVVYEAHSTDYQDGAALRALVLNRFAILKVGPWFTFNFREALFSLSFIEDELVATQREIAPSRFRTILVEVALEDPQHWQGYYSGDSAEILYALKYSLSDRIRYYWTNSAITESVKHLMSNLNKTGIPRALRNQFFPDMAELPAGELDPVALVRARIQQVNRLYSSACTG